MEVAKAAAEMAQAFAHSERPMIFLNIGEPDFTAPPRVRAASERAVSEGRTQYTDATGLPALRESIGAREARLTELIRQGQDSGEISAAIRPVPAARRSALAKRPRIPS